MRNTPIKQAFSMAPITLAVALATLPVVAPAADDPWHLRFSVVSMDSRGTSVFVPETGESISYASSSGIGLGVDLEYRASKRLGIDFGVLSASPGIEVEVGDQPLTVSASGDLNVTPIYAGLNIHLTPDSRFDLYIGPYLAYVNYGEFKLAAGPSLVESFTTESDFGFGGVVGLDIGFGDSQLFLSTTVRYLEATLEATSSDGDPGTTDIDPMIYGLGIGFRF